jgi:hypothetical protein
MVKVGDIVKFSFCGPTLYGIVTHQAPKNYPTRYTVRWFNGILGRGRFGYRAYQLIKVSDAQE